MFDFLGGREPNPGCGVCFWCLHPKESQNEDTMAQCMENLPSIPADEGVSSALSPGTGLEERLLIVKVCLI